MAFGEYKWSKDTTVTFGNGGKLGVASADDVPREGAAEKTEGGGHRDEEPPSAHHNIL